MHRNIRKTTTFAAVAVAAVLATASVAFACVTFKGKMVVDGHDGDTTVVGHGTAHAYCSTGRPATAAAGHLGDQIQITVSPQSCPTGGGSLHDRLPNGTYEVRYNNRTSYVFDGTAYTMADLSGCFFPANAPTTSTIGSFVISGGTGSQTWTGSLSPISPAGVPVYSVPGTASNLCVGLQPGTAYDPVANTGGAPGMLAPYQLIAI